MTSSGMGFAATSVGHFCDEYFRLLNSYWLLVLGEMSDVVRSDEAWLVYAVSLPIDTLPTRLFFTVHLKCW